MSYYLDLFLRPKQATAFAKNNPSVIRGIGFVILPALLSLFSGLLLSGQIQAFAVLQELVLDFLVLVLDCILVLIIGSIFKKIVVTMQSFSQLFSLLAQLSFYRFFLVLIVFLLFPLLVIPGVVSAGQELQQGLIGPEEMEAIIMQAIADLGLIQIILGLIFFLFALILFLYILYSLYLSLSQFLSISTFKTIILMLIFFSFNWLLFQFLLG